MNGAHMANITFDDLKPIDIVVELDHGDRTLEIPLRTLTYAQWNRIGLSVPSPTAPSPGVDKNARPIFDYQDATYLAQLEAAGEERAYRRLLASLQLDVPGATEEEKLKNLRDGLDVNVVRQLNEVIGKFAFKGEARIKHRAETFHEGGVPPIEGDATPGDYKDPI
jgi:hypothetical protein